MTPLPFMTGKTDNPTAYDLSPTARYRVMP